MRRSGGVGGRLVPNKLRREGRERADKRALACLRDFFSFQCFDNGNPLQNRDIEFSLFLRMSKKSTRYRKSDSHPPERHSSLHDPQTQNATSPVRLSSFLFIYLALTLSLAFAHRFFPFARLSAATEAVQHHLLHGSVVLPCFNILSLTLGGGLCLI